MVHDSDENKERGNNKELRKSGLFLGRFHIEFQI